MNLEARVRSAMIDASKAARTAPADTDERDHYWQAHFRLTEALAHIRVAEADEKGRDEPPRRRKERGDASRLAALEVLDDVSDACSDATVSPPKPPPSEAP